MGYNFIQIYIQFKQLYNGFQPSPPRAEWSRLDAPRGPARQCLRVVQETHRSTTDELHRSLNQVIGRTSLAALPLSRCSLYSEQTTSVRFVNVLSVVIHINIYVLVSLTFFKGLKNQLCFWFNTTNK